MVNKTSGLRRVFNALLFSVAGIRATFIHEQAFRHELLIAAFLVPAAFWLAGTTVELALMLGTVLLVLIVELINSAIEAVVDRLGKEHHELAGRAKDMGSGAVFLAMILLVVIWMVLLWPRLATVI